MTNVLFTWQVWHSGGQVVVRKLARRTFAPCTLKYLLDGWQVINDHSNRLDMMQFVDGIYAEMGDMSATDSALGSLNSHGVATACEPHVFDSVILIISATVLH